MAFKVLEVDDDTAYLLDLGMQSAAKAAGVGSLVDTDPHRLLTAVVGAALAGADAMGTAVWCYPNAPLTEGDVVEGSFEFPPTQSMALGRLPRFDVKPQN